MNKIQIKYILQLLKNIYTVKGLKKLYNMLWSYTLWLNYPLRTKIVGLYPKLFNREPYPPFVEIETTTKCPFKCKICEHTYWDQSEQNMSLEQFIHIADQFPKLKWAGITGIGESWSNPQFADMVQYLCEKSNPVIELVDNFALMTEARSRRMIELGVDIFFISMMGSSKETYEKIMNGMRFDNVTKNIERFFALKEELKSVTPVINFHYVISRSNIHEAVNFIDYVASFNADVWEILYTPILHTFSEIQDEEIAQAEVDELKPQLEGRAKKFGLRISYNECIPATRFPIRKCSNWIMPFVFVNGEVSPCCTSNEANQRDRQYRLSMGNIFQQNFNDIWYGEKYRKFREVLRCNGTPEQCRDCPIYVHE
jgi:radical SAM protein with 4Fe4S-binding SPASM domain